MQMLASLSRSWLWVPLVFVSTASTLHADSTALTFGVYTSDKPTVMYKMFKPLLGHLEEKLSKRLEKDVRIELRIFKSYEKANEALVNGDVDFVRFGPASYVIAKRKNPEISLLAIEEKKGKHTFHGVIFTHRDSPVSSLRELKGKTFAFGDENSTIGRYLSQAALADAGIRASDLKFDYLGRHDRVVTSVLHRRHDAGAAKESTYKRYEDRGLKVLFRFENTTKPWVARAGLDPELEASLREALLYLQESRALKHLRISGFGKVKDEDYESVRDGMEKSKRFLEEIGRVSQKRQCGGE